MTPDIARVDRLILDEALAEGAGCPCDVLVADDPELALTAEALTWVSGHHADGAQPGPRVLLCSRDLGQARAAVALAEGSGRRDRLAVAGIDGPLDLEQFLTAERERGAAWHFMLTRLPKALAELDHLARATSVSSDTATLVGGANTKHMTRSQNEVLARWFTEVRATLGQGKFRGLVASGPLPVDEAARASVPAHEDTSVGRVYGIGGVFGGAGLDRGGQFLARAALADMGASATGTVVDLGCGNGSVALEILAALPRVRVIATDNQADAVLSAQRTLEPYADRAEVTWDDAAGDLPSGSADTVLLNPPFHEGTRIDATLVEPLLEAAARLLARGGACYFVHNSHLRYRPLLERHFREVTQQDRDTKFTVLRAEH